MKKKTQELVKYSKDDWFEALLEELKALIVESRFAIEEQIIRAKHEVGRLIVEHEDKASSAELILIVAEQLDVSERTIQQSVQFYRFDPKLTVLNEGKNISWRKCLMRMQKPKMIEPCEHEETKVIHVCTKCGDKVN